MRIRIAGLCTNIYKILVWLFSFVPMLCITYVILIIMMCVYVALHELGVGKNFCCLTKSFSIDFVWKILDKGKCASKSFKMLFYILLPCVLALSKLSFVVAYWSHLLNELTNSLKAFATLVKLLPWFMVVKKLSCQNQHQK